MRFRYLINWWRRRRNFGPRYGSVTVVDSFADVPSITGNTIYVVGRQKPKWVVFGCPCKQDHVLHVPLMETADPHWEMTRRKGRLTLFPSIDVTDRCRSHFWLRDSRVEWPWISERED